MLDIFHGDVIAVKTNKGLHRTMSLILTLGPWASKWLPRLGVNIPLQVNGISNIRHAAFTKSINPYRSAQCFEKASFPDTSKGVIVWEKVKRNVSFQIGLRELRRLI